MALLTREVAYQLIEEQGTDIVIPDIYTSIDQSAFSLSDLTSVVIPESVTSIGALAFWNNDLTSVAIPDSVTTIRVGAFANNPLTSVYIGDNVTSIGETFLGGGDWEFAFTYAPLEFVSISADAPFPVSLFPEGVLIDYRGVDQYPVDIFASTSNFIENIAGGSAVATLSTADPDANGTHAYALVAGDGDADNNAFAIDGDKLKILNSPDFETQSSYSIRLQTTDSAGLNFAKPFTFEVEPPMPTEEDAVEQIESIDDVTTSDEITTFELTEPIPIGDQDVEALIVGTDKKDKITGSSAGEILAGGKAKDVLKGRGGPDGFLFQDPDGFGNKEADKVKDFDSDEGDSVLLDQDVFDLGKRIKLKTVTGKKAAKNASDSKEDFIYDDKKGLLYYNENGKDEGWGDGGLFVKLKDAPELGVEEFAIL